MSDMRESRCTIGGRELAPLALGLARWSIGRVIDDPGAERFLHHALDLGISHLDTARAYTTARHESHSEAMVARVLARRSAHDRPLVATKGGHERAGDTWVIDGRPETLRRHCERSLRTLGAETIDLYYLHMPDPQVPFDESVGALEQLRHEGKIHSVGVSNVTPEQIRIAAEITPLAAVQNRYSPTTPDNSSLRVCAELGIAFVAFSPLGGTARQPLEALSPTVAELAAETTVSVETVWLAWMLALSPVVTLITGARREETLRSSLLAARSPIDAAVVERISTELEAS